MRFHARLLRRQVREMKVADILLEIGITPNLMGFQDIIDAVELINGGEKKLCKIYRMIGMKTGCGYASAERHIRHAVSKAKENKKFVEYFPYSKINNSNFLFSLAYRMKEDKENGK